MGLKKGLYELVGGSENGEVNSRVVEDFLTRNTLDPETRERLLTWKEELKFWEEYAEIYYHMEDTGFYDELVETIKGFIEPKEGDVWLDAGCGPAKMSQLIWEKSKKKVKKIIGTDIVLNPARATLAKFGNSIPLELQYANLGERLPFPNNYFDGIVANISLTYVIDFQGKKGKAAFVEVMKEMFRVLKPGGYIVWSTPKRNPLFWRNFLAGLPDMFSIRKQIQHHVFGLWIGMRILRYGLKIASKGRRGVYTFLEPHEYEKILSEIGFVNFEWKKTFAGQVWANKAHKPIALLNP